MGPLLMLFPLSVSLKPLQPQPCLLACVPGIPTHPQAATPSHSLSGTDRAGPFSPSQPGSHCKLLQTSAKWVWHQAPSPVSPNLPKATAGREGILASVLHASMLHDKARSSLLPKLDNQPPQGAEARQIHQHPNGHTTPQLKTHSWQLRAAGLISKHLCCP